LDPLWVGMWERVRKRCDTVLFINTLRVACVALSLRQLIYVSHCTNTSYIFSVVLRPTLLLGFYGQRVLNTPSDTPGQPCRRRRESHRPNRAADSLPASLLSSVLLPNWMFRPRGCLSSTEPLCEQCELVIGPGASRRVLGDGSNGKATRSHHLSQPGPVAALRAGAAAQHGLG